VLPQANIIDGRRIYCLGEKSLMPLFKVAAFSALVGRACSEGDEVDAVSFFVDMVSTSQH